MGQLSLGTEALAGAIVPLLSLAHMSANLSYHRSPHPGESLRPHIIQLMEYLSSYCGLFLKF